MASDGYFGVCPICKGTDGYVNIGRSHWSICKQHRARWFIGENVFSSWHDKTESEQQREREEIGFDAFTDVKPFYPEIEGVKNEDGNEARLHSKKSGRSRAALVRHRSKKRN
jgi:hypothetical protein